MSSVVVDASVLIACAVADGKTRRVYLSARDVEFYAPAFIREELLKRVPKILAISRVTPTVLSTLLEDLFAQLTVVPRDGYDEQLGEAKKIVRRVDAEGDEDYVALALSLRAPIWTYDKDFLRIKEVRVVRTEQILAGVRAWNDKQRQFSSK